MYSKRFRQKIKKLGEVAVPDWFVYTCWRENIRRFPNTLRLTPDPLFEKHIGE